MTETTVDGVGMLWQLDVRTRPEFENWYASAPQVAAFRRGLENGLQERLAPRSEAIYLGYCVVCRRHSHFTYDWLYSDGKYLNWRERLVCRGCHLNNRLRLSMIVAKQHADLEEDAVYLTEQVSPFARAMRARTRHVSCSEFLGADLLPGAITKQGVRHEDLTRLSFADASFDLVLSFDVLEHIPDYRAALREVRRVLKPRGRFVLSVPMHLGSDDNIMRARLRDDGTIEHLLPAEYHGDPVDPAQGILCYYHFGWQLLHDLRGCGFETAATTLYWSSDLANIGHEQAFVVAEA